MDDQQLLVGIVGGLIGWLIGMTALRLLVYLFVPRGLYYISPRRLKAMQRSMEGFTRTAMGKDPGEPR